MSNCEHSWSTPGRKLNLDTVLDDWLGPTLALVHCEDCREPAVLHLVTWRGTSLNERIYAARVVDTLIRDTYLANIARDYCDLTRKASETEALINACHEDAQLVLMTTPGMLVEAVSAGSFNPPVIPWQEIKTETFDDWMKFLLV